MITEREQKLMVKLNDVNNENHDLRIEVNRLKELLKECKELIKRSFDDYPNSAIYRAINSAISESEE